MNDEYENEEEQSSLESIGESVRQRKALTKNVHRNPNPKVGKTIINKGKNNQPINNKVNEVDKKSSSIAKPEISEEDDELDFSSIGDASSDKTVAGIYNAVKFFGKNKWIMLAIGGGAFFFLILIIASIFLLKNADTLNYQNQNYSEKYKQMYSEIDSITLKYQAKYGVKINKHLIVSILTSYKDETYYKDDTTSGIFDIIEEYENRSKMSVMVETLAKYQIQTNTKCSHDSSSKRKIASNDDSVNILNFWTTEISREKNYNCNGSDETTYDLSIEQGKIDDENSGSVFYWNLIDEGFLKEYYPEYFKGLSGEDYEKKAAQMLNHIYSYAETLKKYDTNNKATARLNGSEFWWPIGSSETIESNGVLLANREPADSNVVTKFSSAHPFLDITSNEEDVNIISTKGGKVIEVRDLGKDSNLEDTGRGSYVVVENYSDGIIVVYAFLEPNSTTVKKGDNVYQGQVIGKMGTNPENSMKMVRIEMHTGGDYSDPKKSAINPESKIDKSNPRAGGNEFSLTTPTLSRGEFIASMELYCAKTGKSGFCNNFSSQAGLVYDISIENNVNPELVVVTAGTEQNWNKCAGLYNFWGIGIPNGKGCSDGPQLTSMEAGIKSYAKTINSYLDGGSYASSITSRYNERSSAGCDPAGHGLPGTLTGMQSVYSWIGNYRYNPGSWGLGGCVYLDIIYGSGYCASISTCKNYDNCPSASKTTTCEQNDYTAWQLQEKVKLRQEIFGV